MDDKTPNDYEGYEEAISDNACPQCGHNEQPTAYAPKPLPKAVPTASSLSDVRVIEGESGDIKIDLATGCIDAPDTAIREAVKHITGLDSLADTTTDARQIIWRAAKELFENGKQIPLFDG